MAKVLGYIERGRGRGQGSSCGGAGLRTPALADGYFVEPTVFDDCTDDMAIVREEIFGPVMAVLASPTRPRWSSAPTTPTTASPPECSPATCSGPTGSCAALEAGTTWINNYNITPIELPFGGYKQSGIGRENSLTTINHYTQLKSVYVEMGDVEAPY